MIINAFWSGKKLSQLILRLLIVGENIIQTINLFCGHILK